MGFIKGLTKQAFAVLGLILGIILGTMFYKPFADFLKNIMNMPDRPASIVAFFIILLVVPLLCGALGNLLSRLLHVANFGFLDRLLGAAFGLLKYLIIMGLIIKLVDITGFSDKFIHHNTERKQSKMYVYVNDFTDFCLKWTWDKIEESAEELVPELKDKKDNKKDTTDKQDQKKV